MSKRSFHKSWASTRVCWYRTGKRKDLVHASSGQDIVFDFELGQDRLQFGKGLKLNFQQLENGLIIQAKDQGDTREIILYGIQKQDFDIAESIVRD